VSANEDNPDCTVARCPSCKNVIFAMVNSLSTAKDPVAHEELAKLIRDGFTIEKLSLPETRKAPFGCEYNEEPTP
jgi:hypothetical protein